MKPQLLRYSLVELCLLGTLIGQGQTQSSGVNLAGFISIAEGGVSALNAANAAQSSKEAAKSASADAKATSVGLGGVISAADAGITALKSANAAQSSAQAASSAALASASRTQTAQSDATGRASSKSPSAGATSGQSRSSVTATATASGSGSASGSSLAASASASSTSGGGSAGGDNSSGGSGSSKHLTLIIALSVVFGLLAIGLIILALICCCTRRRRRSRLFQRHYTPDEDEVDSWRHHDQPEMTGVPAIGRNSMQYAHVPAGPLSPGPYGGERPPSHPFPYQQPDLQQHPAMRQNANVPQEQNPFIPVPPPPRRGAPNSRPGLTDEARPGDEPFVGASIVRPRSLNSGRLRSTSNPRRGSGPVLRDSSSNPSSSHESSGSGHGHGTAAALGAGALGAAAGAAAMHHHQKSKGKSPDRGIHPDSDPSLHPTSIPITDLPPTHSGSNRNSATSTTSSSRDSRSSRNLTDTRGQQHGNPYRESRPATPMALMGFGSSVGKTGEMNPYGPSNPQNPRHSHPLQSSPPHEPQRAYAPYHDYEWTPPAMADPSVPPPSPPRSPARNHRGTPPLIPSRSPKRLSGTPTPPPPPLNYSDSSDSSQSVQWRMSQMPGSWDTPRSGPPTPGNEEMRRSGEYFPAGSAAGTGNGSGRKGRLRLSDLRAQEERDWYRDHHNEGYGVGTAL